MTLPIGPGSHWARAAPDHPAWLILELLTASVGLPFVLLSSTTPLLQHWVARAGDAAPYRFFAVSNLASLLALLAYPLLIEPALDMNTQRVCWSALYVVFVSLCTAAAWRSSRLADSAIVEATLPSPACGTAARPLLWFALAACGSMLLLSITNHVTQNVAPVPLLWVLPLAAYLLSYVLCFSRATRYHRTFWLRALAVALGALGYAVSDINAIEAIQVSLPVFFLGLFTCCIFCHGELASLRPSAQDLTRYYVLIAAGGAVGAIFVGIIAPKIFRGIYELPVALLFTALVAVAAVWQSSWALRLVWLGVSAAMAVVTAQNVKAFREDTVTMRRSFYGSLRVVESRHGGAKQYRTLFNGTIEHGAQFLLPPLRSRPTSYYGPDSGIGIVLRECFPAPKRIGVVGLGVGTVAAYGDTGDVFRFYEINQQVADIAQSLFFYLRESRARTEMVIGDGRLSLERETGAPFDVLALDAFSGDAIPIHLLTQQALALYSRHLNPAGVLAFHVSNHYLDLASVVQQLAAARGYESILVRNEADADRLIEPADWVLVTRNPAVLHNASIAVHRRTIAPRPGLRLWTDDYNNLLQILKPVKIQ
ncbi:MAG: fused MFS/spermidine synthase [Acidobacteriaceae bacterium]|nr:fused MFS/spermidine synthase [Acidobacteriaceae bacterium]